LHGARETEVGDAGFVAPRDHDVVGLEVAVEDPRLVRGREAGTRLEEHIEDLAPRTRSRSQPGVERLAFDELHHEVDAVFVEADFVRDDDVRVRDASHGPRFLHEPQRRRAWLARIAQSGAQELDGDRTVELRIVRAIDLAHGAFADEPENDEPADERAGPDVEGRRGQVGVFALARVQRRGWRVDLALGKLLPGFAQQQGARLAVGQVGGDVSAHGRILGLRREREDLLLIQTAHARNLSPSCVRSEEAARSFESACFSRAPRA